MQPPTDPPVPAPRWVSFAEAQKILNMTEGTLRRAIKAGTVQGEQRRRNPDSPTDQRMVYEVLVMDAPGAAAAAAAPIEAVSATEATTMTPDATMRALDILETLLRANGETMERQAEQITKLHGLLWQAEHDKARAEALAESLAVERASAMLERDELREELRELKDRPWYRRLW